MPVDPNWKQKNIHGHYKVSSYRVRLCRIFWELWCCLKRHTPKYFSMSMDLLSKHTAELRVLELWALKVNKVAVKELLPCLLLPAVFWKSSFRCWPPPQYIGESCMIPFHSPPPEEVSWDSSPICYWIPTPPFHSIITALDALSVSHFRFPHRQQRDQPGKPEIYGTEKPPIWFAWNDLLKK